MRAFFSMLCFLFLLGSASASTVTVSMAQNKNAPAIAVEMTRVIEDQIMNDYFASGEIVSNMEIVENCSSFDNPMFSVKEASHGMSDFLLAVFLEYGPDEKKFTDSEATYAELKEVNWRVVDVRSPQVLGSGSFKVSNSRVQEQNPYECARIIAGLISKEGLKIQNGDNGGNK